MKLSRLPILAYALTLIVSLSGIPSASAEVDPNMPVETKADMEAYINLLRKDFEVVKVDLINDAMGLSVDDSAVFWPIYQQYETERKALVDARFGIIYDFAQTIDEMTDKIATDLVSRSFALERSRTDLKEKYFGLLSEKLGPRKAARFLQAESQLEALVNFRLAAEIPLID